MIFFKDEAPFVEDYDDVRAELVKQGWLQKIYNVELNRAVYDITDIGYQYYFAICMELDYDSLFGGPKIAEGQTKAFINENIDPDWVPILQTPPFPEHTSGHSVISRAAAIALTSIFGDDFSYEDDVELQYGLPVRKFNSFIEASEEAAISRLYGGIHYMPSITYGVQQGEAVGKFVVENLSMVAYAD